MTDAAETLPPQALKECVPMALKRAAEELLDRAGCATARQAEAWISAQTNVPDDVKAMATVLAWTRLPAGKR